MIVKNLKIKGMHVLNYHNITTCDMKNGEGLRVVLWVSGCSHKCKNCHNPQTWNVNSGIEFDKLALDEVLIELSKDYHCGLTLSGGDPLHCSNRDALTDLVKMVKNIHPEKTIWVYTGYTFEEVKNLEIIEYIDVLVDGKYDENLSFPSPKWCGSSNQRVIDVKESLIQDKVVLYTPAI